MIITTIQGVVVTTMRDTKVVMASIRLKTKRPMKINAQARLPTTNVALGRLSLGKTLEKSSPFRTATACRATYRWALQGVPEEERTEAAQSRSIRRCSRPGSGTGARVGR